MYKFPGKGDEVEPVNFVRLGGRDVFADILPAGLCYLNCSISSTESKSV